MRNNQPTPILIRLGALIFGIPFAAMGIIVLLNTYGYFSTHQVVPFSTKAMTTLGACVLIFAGAGMVLFSLGITQAAARAGVMASLFFLLTFNWIAFGPGERHFIRKISSSFTATSVSKSSETEGRVVFGLIAGLMDLLVVYSLLKSRRR